jgi:hypothetical protein
MLIPLYHKIRIPFLKIKEIVCDYDTQMLDILNLNLHKINNDQDLIEYDWDIYLNSVSEFKKYLRKIANIDQDIKLNVLTRDFPKFLWIADAYHKNEIKFTYIFDATDIENGKLFICAFHYDNSFQFIQEIAKSDLYEKQTFQSRRILDEYKIDKHPNVFYQSK